MSSRRLRSQGGDADPPEDPPGPQGSSDDPTSGISEVLTAIQEQMRSMHAQMHSLQAQMTANEMHNAEITAMLAPVLDGNQNVPEDPLPQEESERVVVMRDNPLSSVDAGSQDGGRFRKDPVKRAEQLSRSLGSVDWKQGATPEKVHYLQVQNLMQWLLMAEPIGQHFVEDCGTQDENGVWRVSLKYWRPFLSSKIWKDSGIFTSVTTDDLSWYEVVKLLFTECGGSQYGLWMWTYWHSYKQPSHMPFRNYWNQCQSLHSLCTLYAPDMRPQSEITISDVFFRLSLRCREFAVSYTAKALAEERPLSLAGLVMYITHKDERKLRPSPTPPDASSFLVDTDKKSESAPKGKHKRGKGKSKLKASGVVTPGPESGLAKTTSQPPLNA